MELTLTFPRVHYFSEMGKEVHKCVTDGAFQDIFSVFQNRTPSLPNVNTKNQDREANKFTFRRD